jgi:hypothetical protein
MQIESVMAGSSISFEIQTGSRQTADDQVRAVLDPLQLPLDRTGQVREIGSGEVGLGQLEQAPDPFLRVDLRRVRRAGER